MFLQTKENCSLLVRNITIHSPETIILKLPKVVYILVYSERYMRFQTCIITSGIKVIPFFVVVENHYHLTLRWSLSISFDFKLMKKCSLTILLFALLTTPFLQVLLSVIFQMYLNFHCLVWHFLVASWPHCLCKQINDQNTNQSENQDSRSICCQSSKATFDNFKIATL